MPTHVIYAPIRWVADPPWPRGASLLASALLTAYALFDAFQPAGTPSPVTIAWEAGLPLADKWMHWLGYGAVALFGCQALVQPVLAQSAAPRGVSGRMSAVLQRVAPSPLAAAAAVGLGSLLVSVMAEVIQAAMGLGRAGELEDVLVSGCGAGLAVVAFLLSRLICGKL